MVKFNPQQQKAIDFFEGACAVIAGAGSGKSTVLINRIKNLIEVHGVPQEEILAISFTNNTATELRTKLKNLGYYNVNVGTFHAICSKILSYEGMGNRPLIPTYKIEQCFKSEGDKLDVNDIISFIGFQKSYNKSYEDQFVPKDSQYSEIELRRYYKAYEEFKQQEGYIDFDDILIDCYKLLRDNFTTHTYDFVLVDEHQDSNLIQNMLLKELCVSNNMFCVFDYRQAIYSFRGGDTEYCMNFSRDWENATVINLDMNYRSTNNIVEDANKFIKKYYGNYEYYSDSISSNKENGLLDINAFEDRSEEGVYVSNKIEGLINAGEDVNDIAVLFRLNTHAGNVEFELKQKEIPYESSNGGSFFKRKEIMGIISYLRLINNPLDDVAFENIFKFRNYPLAFFSNAILDEVKRKAGMYNRSYYETFIDMSFDKPWQAAKAKEFEEIINKLTMQHLKEVPVLRLIENVIKSFSIEAYIENNYSSVDEREERLNALDVLKTFVKYNNLEQFINFTYETKRKSNSKKDAVKLMSVHQSKGLEFKHVFLIGVEDQKFPHSRSTLLEEARLFYVAVTRSKKDMYLSQIGINNKFIEEYRKDKIKGA